MFSSMWSTKPESKELQVHHHLHLHRLEAYPRGQLRKKSKEEYVEPMQHTGNNGRIKCYMEMCG